MLIFAVATCWDVRFAAFIKNAVMQMVGILGAVGENLALGSRLAHSQYATAAASMTADR